jgi:hypothetical protein
MSIPSSNMPILYLEMVVLDVYNLDQMPQFGYEKPFVGGSNTRSRWRQAILRTNAFEPIIPQLNANHSESLMQSRYIILHKGDFILRKIQLILCL